MNTRQLTIFILLLGTLAMTIFFIPFTNDSDHSSPEPPPDDDDGDSSEIMWGVDSANYTDNDLYTCVKENFGEPEVWGRYLGDKEDVSMGLDEDEVKLLHDQDIHILIIYNHFTDAEGYDRGVEEAKEAIQYAKDLEVPANVAIFGDIEPDYAVDADFIKGWYETIADSDYEPAVYGVFDEDSALKDAFEATDDDIQKNMVVWTAYPQEDMTTKDDAPKFNGEGPNDARLYGWQYAIEAESCNIDTNLFKEDMIDYLWKP